MNYLNLDIIKKQLRMDASFTDDDDLLTLYGDSVEAFVEQHLNCALDDITAENSGELPKNIINAMLLLVDYLYDHSGSGDRDIEIPNSMWILLAPWKKYSIA